MVEVEVEIDEADRIDSDSKKSRMVKNMGVVGCFHTSAPHSQVLQE